VQVLFWAVSYYTNIACPVFTACPPARFACPSSPRPSKPAYRAKLLRHRRNSLASTRAVAHCSSFLFSLRARALFLSLVVCVGFWIFGVLFLKETRSLELFFFFFFFFLLHLSSCAPCVLVHLVLVIFKK